MRPLLAAALSLALAQPAEAMDFTHHVYKGRLAIMATGSIEEGDGDKFEAFLKTLPAAMLDQPRNFVFLGSPGGSITEGLKIGAAIERRHFYTGVIGEQCSSACVLAWAAGERKYTNQGKCIGVHSSIVGVDALAGKMPEVEAKAALENLQDTANIGMAMWFWDHHAPAIVTLKILHTPSTSLYCLTPEDLAAWNVKVMP